MSPFKKLAAVSSIIIVFALSVAASEADVGVGGEGSLGAAGTPRIRQQPPTTLEACSDGVCGPPDAGVTSASDISGRDTSGNSGVDNVKVPESEKYLSDLRKEMQQEGVGAYVILSSDDHQSEYLADHDKRRQFISHFTGSSGDAVVTLTKAALWTDSRYFLQAERELDENWTLMKQGEPNIPSIEEWIISELKADSIVSTDPRIASYSTWSSMNKTLSNAGVKLSYLESNLVDRVWKTSTGRPSYPCGSLISLPVVYSGMLWENKVNLLRKKMSDKSADGFVVTALDEIAWLFNLRGDDIPYTPVFRSYVIFGPEKDPMGNWSLPTLYLPDFEKRVTKEVMEHLKTSDGHYLPIKNYEDFWEDLRHLGSTAKKVLLPSPYSYTKGASYAIIHEIPPAKISFLPSPVAEMKAKKNSVEAKGMKSAHIKDGTALVEFFHKIETGVKQGEYWDEIKAGNVATYLRSRQPLSHGPSFESISAFGSNSALPHYAPTNETNKIIDGDHIFMFDSGGQYLDGTTDVTRTLFLGSAVNVTDEMKDIYTRLLMGVADLASVVFPEGTTMQNLEILIRRHLYLRGLNYGHGSTHGIGHFLGVHEAFDYAYAENFFGSQEPGYYIPDKFGMRLENIVTVVPKIMPNAEKKYFGFETVTLVPYERKLINPQMMSNAQLDWVNGYHQQVMEVIGSQLRGQGSYYAHAWLEEKTQPIETICKI